MSTSSSVQQVSPSQPSESVIRGAICTAETLLGYRLKREQEESVYQLVSGRDVFVSLPTGYGKSLCYTILPLVFDAIQKVKSKSIVIVVSPLSALMKDQVAAITNMGILGTNVTDVQFTPPSVMMQIEHGEFQMIFISPEALFRGTVWRRLLCTDIYRENLVAFVVDEAHCIKNWYVITL